MTKICTDIEQSKLLAEILPLESADMTWVSLFDLDHTTPKHSLSLTPYSLYSGVGVPAWSLSALLKLFNDKAGVAQEYDGTWFAYDNGNSYCSKYYYNPLDAAFEMVVWLKENKKI